MISININELLEQASLQVPQTACAPGASDDRRVLW